MTDDPSNPRVLIALTLHDLAAETEGLLLMAQALEDRATGIANNAPPQKLREIAALVKGTVLQLGMAAANIVGTAERLRIVAAFDEVSEPNAGELPS